MKQDKRSGPRTVPGPAIQPTLMEWKALYETADVFKQSACWQWLDDGAIFGVEDPEDGLRYYCSVMGGGGMEYGLMAFRGIDGLEYLCRLLAQEDDIETSDLAEDAMFLQNSLTCSFENREDLAREDLAVIKELGLKFRGRQQWPMFRDYTPGQYPWYLTGAQCRILTRILQQTLAVSEQCKQAGAIDILNGSDDEIFFRVAEKTAISLKWSNRFLKGEEEKIAYAQLTLSDQVMLQKLKKLPLQKRQTLEADLFYLSSCIRDKECRPYFPRVLGIIDHVSGAALHVCLVENQEMAEVELADALIELLLKTEKKPHRILVKQESLQIALVKLGEQIGSEIRLVGHLPKLFELRQSFEKFNQR